MKVLKHDCNEPGRAGLARSGLRFADHNDGRKSERGEGRLQVGWELPRPAVNVVTSLLKVFRWASEVRQIFCVGSDQQQRSRRLAPAGPDLILNLGGKAIELADANSVVGRDRLRRLGEQRRREYEDSEYASHRGDG